MYRRIWTDLQRRASALDEKGSLEVVFNLLKEWFNSNKNNISKKVDKDYGISEKLSVCIADYSMGGAEYSVREFKEQCKHFQPSSADSMCMFVRDVIGDILVFRSEVVCPICDYFDLAAMYDSGGEQVVLFCEQCDWIQDLEGAEYKTKSKLKYANTVQIVNSGCVNNLHSK